MASNAGYEDGSRKINEAVFHFFMGETVELLLTQVARKRVTDRSSDGANVGGMVGAETDDSVVFAKLEQLGYRLGQCIIERFGGGGFLNILARPMTRLTGDGDSI